MSESSFDIVVVGGGIVGLATARELLGRKPGSRLLILEKEPTIGAHQTGHNSGVIHSGIYYTPGSLKARNCVAGAAALMEYCDRRGIPYERNGKVIVARNAEELPRLEALYQRGVENGVQGLELIGPERLRELEPHAIGVRAIWSPNTGIVDYARVAAAYAEDIQELGGQIRVRHAVESIGTTGSKAIVESSEGTFEASLVITCAGAYADRVAAMTGAPRNPRIVPFRGDFYVLRPSRAHLVRNSIYPVPDPAFPFLGVHLTRRTNGEIWLGPNAVLAFSREGYRLTDVNLRDLSEAIGYVGFQRLARKHWRTGLAEMYRDVSKKAFLATLQEYVPEIQESDLIAGPSGVRAQALGDDGQLIDDFVVQRDGPVLHVRNAPSPAATSSLAIGKLIADTALS